MEDLEVKFRAMYEKDKQKYIKSWMVTWDYQVKRKKRGVKYKEGKPEDFYSYNGPQDLVKWMGWFDVNFTTYLPDSLTGPLINKSFETDKRIINELGLKFEFPNYAASSGINNAHDFIYPQFYPVPERQKIKTVLDFGAGCGRQANLWATSSDDMTYVGMDAIPNSYCLQHLYYSHLGVKLYDYMDNPEIFSFDSNKKGIYHIPTWRYDLLPDGYFDMVICVQVLQELNTTLVETMLTQFHRILKPGGMLYIRDHATKWQPATKLNIDKYLSRNGFTLEFSPYTIDPEDVHGIVRIWRKNDPRIIESRQRSFKAGLRQIAEDIDALSGGSLRKIRQKMK
ncbi:MAG TPA: class I SAM-dependent methyltransferase [Bacteroidia bacterium]|jgi:ubiquinone/menaquinone biosynthesis C-methylase UbiE|nr:class I SAM-dependent methyltransferase [Bacteroidia bacterium]